MKIIVTPSELIISRFDSKAMLFWLILGGSFIFIGSLITVDRSGHLKFITTFGFKFALLTYGPAFLLFAVLGLLFRCSIKLESILVRVPIPYLRLEWKAQHEQLIINIHQNSMKLGWILIISRKDGNLKMPFFLKKDALKLAEKMNSYYGKKCEIQK